MAMIITLKDKLTSEDKESDDMEGIPAWGLGEVLTTPLHKKKIHVKNYP
jgi:hypothetical protein